MKGNASAAAAELVGHFRRQRPLRGGSLIITIFGDTILPRGGAVSLGSLISLAEPFGLNERLIRTATARLATEGWLEGQRSGRTSEYRLSGRGREQFVDATKRIYNGVETKWSGAWTLIALRPMPAAERTRLRKELVWRGFGEISNGLFAHPELDPGTLDLQLRAAGLRSQVIVFGASLAGSQAPEALIGLGWDLEELGARYQRFTERFEPVLGALASPRKADGQACFIIRTLLIHQYRRLHLRDPLLPAGLLPPDWQGTKAAELCREIYARVLENSETHISGTAARLEGPLPPPDVSILQRFGGLKFR